MLVLSCTIFFRCQQQQTDLSLVADVTTIATFVVVVIIACSVFVFCLMDFLESDYYKKWSDERRIIKERKEAEREKERQECEEKKKREREEMEQRKREKEATLLRRRLAKLEEAGRTTTMEMPTIEHVTHDAARLDRPAQSPRQAWMIRGGRVVLVHENEDQVVPQEAPPPIPAPLAMEEH